MPTCPKCGIGTYDNGLCSTCRLDELRMRENIEKQTRYSEEQTRHLEKQSIHAAEQAQYAKEQAQHTEAMMYESMERTKIEREKLDYIKISDYTAQLINSDIEILERLYRDNDIKEFLLFCTINTKLPYWNNSNVTSQALLLIQKRKSDLAKFVSEAGTKHKDISDSFFNETRVTIDSYNYYTEELNKHLSNVINIVNNISDKYPVYSNKHNSELDTLKSKYILDFLKSDLKVFQNEYTVNNTIEYYYNMAIVEVATQLKKLALTEYNVNNLESYLKSRINSLMKMIQSLNKEHDELNNIIPSIEFILTKIITNNKFLKKTAITTAIISLIVGFGVSPYFTMWVPFTIMASMFVGLFSLPFIYFYIKYLKNYEEIDVIKFKSHVMKFNAVLLSFILLSSLLYLGNLGYARYKYSNTISNYAIPKNKLIGSDWGTKIIFDKNTRYEIIDVRFNSVILPFTFREFNISNKKGDDWFESNNFVYEKK